MEKSGKCAEEHIRLKGDIFEIIMRSFASPLQDFFLYGQKYFGGKSLKLKKLCVYHKILIRG